MTAQQQPQSDQPLQIQPQEGSPPSGLQIHVTAIYDYLTCPRMYHFHHVDGLVPKTESVKLSFGRGMHRALATYYQSRSSAQAIAAYQEWLAEEQAKLQTSGQPPDKSWTDVERIGQPLLAAYLDYASSHDDFYTESVEQPFVVPVWIPGQQDTQMLHPFNGQPVFHMGTFDGVVRNTYGKLWLIEHKTAQAFPSAQFLNVDLQVGLYLLAAKQLYEEEVCGVIYNVLRKVDPARAKTPVVGRWLTSRSGYELSQAVEVLYRTTTRMLTDTHFDPAPGLHCGWKCAYGQLCLCLQDGVDPSLTIEQLYAKREPQAEDSKGEEVP